MSDSVFDSVYNPDVLSCLANLSNDEVFTPPEIANQMLDMLPQELFKDPNTTFLDPACKSGVFLREITKRLIVGLEDKIPDLQERIDHILHKQVYGVAITTLTSFLSRRSIYCSKYPSGKYSVSHFNGEEPQGHIIYKETEHTFRDGACIYCGASKKTFGKKERKDLESHAYQFIHTHKPEEVFNMKFDVIIGNPPYQLSDGGQKASATPIYNLFVDQAKKLNPRYLIMIIPARWYAGGRGLDEFRGEMLKDREIVKLVDYPDSNDCFPGVDIAGGVCYFLWARGKNEDCVVTSISKNESHVSERRLDEFPTFVRFSQAVPILEKIKDRSAEFADAYVSSQKPFGLRTYVTPEEGGDLVLRYTGGEGPFHREHVTAGLDWIDKWKVISSYLTYDHAGRPDKDGKRRIFSTMGVLPPETICTETYLVLGTFDSQAEAENYYNYLRTKFVRFIIAQLTYTQHLSKANFSLVPWLDFREAWDDQRLAAYFSLTKDETDFIDSMIRSMED